MQTCFQSHLTLSFRALFCVVSGFLYLGWIFVSADFFNFLFEMDFFEKNFQILNKWTFFVVQKKERKGIFSLFCRNQILWIEKIQKPKLRIWRIFCLKRIKVSPKQKVFDKIKTFFANLLFLMVILASLIRAAFKKGGVPNQTMKHYKTVTKVDNLQRG